MPLPEKEELGITVAQLISSSAFYWSTEQNKHLGWSYIFHFKNRLRCTLHLICMEGVDMESWQGIAGVLSVPMSAHLAVASLCPHISSIYDLKEERCRSRNLLPAWGGRKTPLEFIICHLPPWRQLRAELFTCGWDLKWADARRERHFLLGLAASGSSNRSGNEALCVPCCVVQPGVEPFER